MEFTLIYNVPLKYHHGQDGRQDLINSGKEVIDELTKKQMLSSSCLTFDPVIDEEGGASLDTALDWKPSREISIDLLFWDPVLAKELKMGSVVPITTHLTLTSSQTGRLTIETKLVDSRGVEVDIFEELQKLEKCLPPNSFEFILGLKDFRNVDKKDEKLDFVERGLKLVQNGCGSVILETSNINFPEAIWWEEWNVPEVTHVGKLSLNVRVDFAAITELYKKISGGGPKAAQLATATDMLIFAGRNKDKEKAIKCHKSILSEMSTKFGLMFQPEKVHQCHNFSSLFDARPAFLQTSHAKMLEAKENSIEIADFSEDCIRALIDFAYRRNVEEALKSSGLAFELFQLAYKYRMKKLMDIVLHIVCYMPFVWFDVDKVIKFVCCTKNVWTDVNVALAEKKGWMVLNWYAKKYPEKLKGSMEYESLCKNRRAGKELGLQLLTKAKTN